MENKPPPLPRAPGRPRTIDRERVLDTAQRIVAESGAQALTIDAVARSMGITKGGVQYAFGTKEALIQAMLDRWCADYSAAMRARTGPDATPLAEIAAHVDETFELDAKDHAKGAAMLAALLRSPEHLGSTRTWYRERLAGLDVEKPEDRKARLVFLATEGAYLLRYFGLLDIDEAEWRDMHADIAALLRDRGGPL